jgi:polysaccharide export outer membrane protein
VVDGKRESVPVRLQDLLRDGDISANVAILPGDILVIPEGWF